MRRDRRPHRRRTAGRALPRRPPGRWPWTIEAWTDAFASWRDELERKVAAGQARPRPASCREGARPARATPPRAPSGDDRRRSSARSTLRDATRRAAKHDAALGPDAARASSSATRTAHERDDAASAARVDVDRARARFGAWYELFPRSWGGLRGRRSEQLPAAGRARLRRPLPAADPPDRPHEPQGPQQRARSPAPDDPGSPWAIGDADGGHDAIHPDLGTMEDFDALVADGARARHRHRAGLRDPVLARPPVAHGAPRVVSPPPRRDAEVRREPAQEVPGHLQRQLRSPRTGRAVGGAAATSCCTGSTTASRVFRVDNPHTKPFAVLGVADRARSARDAPRR